MKHETNCSDGIDNDADGSIDSVDSDCTLPAYFPGCAAGQTLRVYKSYDTPLAVPDNLPAGVTSSVYVVDNIGIIASAATLLNLTHTYDSDLNLTLNSPANASFDLTSGNGTSGDNYTNTILAGGCPTVTTGVAPFSACYAPEVTLATLAGTPAQGVWKLKSVDTVGTDIGTLNNWALVLCIAP
jgi:subtilisin-like proprotein convertase family protein